MANPLITKPEDRTVYEISFILSFESDQAKIKTAIEIYIIFLINSSILASLATENIQAKDSIPTQKREIAHKGYL